MQPGNNQLLMIVLVTPDMASLSDNVHGDTLPRYLDEVIYACANHYAGHCVVTLSVGQVISREPIHVGELMTLLAPVNYTGRAPMEIGVKVTVESIRRQSVRHTNSCFFTMVTLDGERKPAAAHPLGLETTEQKRRFTQAQ